MGLSEQPAANHFVRYARKVYHPIGFTKGYNFVLFSIFGGAFLAFCLSRTPYMNISGRFCKQQTTLPNWNSFTLGSTPGDCYYYDNFQVEKIGIRLHLYTVIPAGILAVFQFIPVIRHKLLLFHRLNGYLTILLGLLGAIGGLMIARTAFGGTLDTQTATGALFIATTVSLLMAYVNIKRLQIDQHRAWMLRAWSYFASVVTLRIILRAIARIVTNSGDYYMVQPCDKLQYTLFHKVDILLALYPDCEAYVNGSNPRAVTIAKASIDAFDPVQITSGLAVGFGTCIWLALLLHIVGMEIYLHLTPREAQRLRTISYQRQLEAGYKNPGNGGLTVQRFGDAEAFVPTLTAMPNQHDHHYDSQTAMSFGSSSLHGTIPETKPPHLIRSGAKTVDSGSSSE